VSPEQITAILTGITGIIVALGVVVHNLVELRRSLNGRLSQLVDATREAAVKQGELQGRDYANKRTRRKSVVVEDLQQPVE
jgi:hypothetical protein